MLIQEQLARVSAKPLVFAGAGGAARLVDLARCADGARFVCTIKFRDRTDHDIAGRFAAIPARSSAISFTPSTS